MPQPLPFRFQNNSYTKAASHISRSQILKKAKYQISKHQTFEHTGTSKLKDTLGNAFCSCRFTSIVTALKSATLDWHLLSLTTRIYHIMVHRNGRAVSSCTLFQRRYLMGMLFYARTLINSQQKLLTTFVFGWALRSLKNRGKLDAIHIQQTALRTTPR